MAWTADAIIVPITTDLGGYTAGLDQATAGARRAGNQLTEIFRNVGRTLFNPIVLAAGAAVSAILSVRSAVRSVSAAMEQIDSAAKFSDRIGIATENLIALRYAAEQTGVGAANLDLSLQRMTRRLAAAAEGGGPAAASIEALGLSARELAAMEPDQQFMAIADAMEQVQSQGERVMHAFQIFDQDGAALTNTMRGGADAIRAAMEEAEQLGLTFDRVDAAKVEMANDAFTRINKVIESVWQSLAIELAPYIQAVADLFGDAAKESGGFGQYAVAAVEGVAKGIAYVSDWLSLLQAGFKLLQAGATARVQEIVWVVEKLARGISWVWEKLGGEGFDTSFLTDLTEGLAQDVERLTIEAGEAFDDFMTGANSTKVTTFFDEVKRKSQEAAEEIAENAKTTGGALDDIGDAAVKQQEKINEALAGIQKEIQQFGMSDLDIRLAEFQAMEGVTDAQAAAFAESIKQLKALRTGQEIQDAVDAWREGLKTPLESLSAEIDKLDEWHAKELITDAEWERGREILGKQLKEMMPDVPTDTGPKLAGFLRAGSQEAFRLQAQLQTGAGRDQIPREQLRVAQDQRGLLEEISRKLDLELA